MYKILKIYCRFNGLSIFLTVDVHAQILKVTFKSVKSGCSREVVVWGTEVRGCDFYFKNSGHLMHVINKGCYKKAMIS